MPNETLCLTRDESQTLDRETIEKFAIPSIILMENAGRSAVDFFLPYYHNEAIYSDVIHVKIACCYYWPLNINLGNI